MDFIEVEIINWSKHNPRSTIKAPRWFALSNAIFEDPDFYDFTHSEVVAWIYILCQASRKNSSVVRLNFKHAAKIASITKNCLESTLSKLQKLECIRVRDHDMNTNVHAVITTRQDKTGQDKQNTIAQPDGFAVFWSGYPRKVGKSKAESKYNAALRAGHSPDDLIKARDNYLNHLKQNQTEAKYIKHGSSFMSEWKDWLDPSAGESKSFGEKKKSTLEVLKEALGGS